MDDYTIKEKDKEVAGITVTYDDGSTKEIQQGCCVDLKNGSDDLSVELLNIKAFDLVKLTYGLMVVIEKIGLEDAFNAYARGETILEENLGRRIKVRLFDGAEYEGYLRKSGDERYRNDPNLYLPKNYYFLTDDYGVCKTCLFRVSHIQNYKILA